MLWFGSKVKNVTSGLSGTVTAVARDGGMTVQRHDGSKVAYTPAQVARFLRKA